MKKPTFATLTIILLSCNSNEEINSLKNKVKELEEKSTLSKKDSLTIYKDIENNKTHSKAIKLLDSIRKNDENLYFEIRTEFEYEFNPFTRHSRAELPEDN